MTAPDDLPRIDLTQAVQVVRDQLMAAASHSTGQDLRFDVGEIQMEFAVELRRDTRVKGGVKAWVVSADADTGRGTAHTHKVAFTLKPKDARTGGDWEIGNAGPDADLSAFGSGDS
ncbi:trypco2 family protein [Streptomyces sp. NPDC058665]|uniref:trypco2 family protein n=1 Tax=Streptomyces sp. NPDC058665 TaxID=3346586 RepID=UPI00364CDF81